MLPHHGRRDAAEPADGYLRCLLAIGSACADSNGAVELARSLHDMAERALSVGGIQQIESTPDGGTTVLVRMPCGPGGRSLDAA